VPFPVQEPAPIYTTTAISTPQPQLTPFFQSQQQITPFTQTQTQIAPFAQNQPYSPFGSNFVRSVVYE
jgi:hypothetical protein